MTSTETASHSAVAKDTRPLVLDIFLILGLLALVACAGLVFLIPWLPPLPAGGQALARYAPVVHGDSWSGVEVSAVDGSKTFRSQNTLLLVRGRALTGELHATELEVLRKFMQKPGETSLDESVFNNRIAAIQIFVQDEQTLAADGKIVRTSSVILRTGSGDYQLSAYIPADNRDLVFDPPLLLHPAGFQPGATWQSQGTVGNGFQYRSGGSISAAPAYAGALGNHSDCLQVTLDLEIDQQGGQQVSSTRFVDGFCSGVSLVSEQTLDANGKLLSQMQVVSSSRYAGQAAQRTPLAALPASPQTGQPANPAVPFDPAGWALSMIGRVRSGNDTTESTVQPVWAAVDPPLLLVAGYSGDLVALDVTLTSGQVLWRYHPSGSIYGQPTYDALHQQIYFGTTGKQLVALDPRGLFRWSFDSGDNIVTTPVVVGDSLVFGSEDRNVYGLDARSGQVLWSYTTRGAVVASPAVDGETVMIASDDGVVYAFNAKTGEKLWVFSTEDAVEAPLVVQDGTLFIASRDMNLYAVVTASGQALWQTQIGHLLRTRPAVGKEAVYLLDEDGHITAVERTHGKLLWTSVERDYLGAPLLVGNTLLAGGRADTLYRLSLDGKRQVTVLGSQTAPTVTESDFRLGLVEGGGVVWAVDTRGFIWRFGPLGSGSLPLELAWSTTLSDPPFQQSFFYSAPVVWNDQFIVADQNGNVYRLNPATGQAGLLGKFKPEPGNFRAGLVLSGDVLLAASVNNLYAAHLPDMTLMWQFQGSGFSLQPAAVEGSTVLWVTTANDGPANANQNHLYAIDFNTGKLKWQADVSGKPMPGNAIIRKGIVFLNTPLSAYDLVTGRQMWQAVPGVDGDGGAAISPNGDTIYTGLTDPASKQGQVAAFSTSDGSLRWVKNLGADNVSILDVVRLVRDALIVPLTSGTRGILLLETANGNERWHYTPAEPRFGNVTIFPATVWLTLENGQVVVLSNQSGVELARLGLTQTSLESYNFAQSVEISGNYVITPAGWWLWGLKLPGGLQP